MRDASFGEILICRETSITNSHLMASLKALTLGGIRLYEVCFIGVMLSEVEVQWKKIGAL